MNRLIIWLLVAGTFAAAQVTQVYLTQQIQVANAQPGWLLVVGSDGKVTAAPAPPVPHTVFGSPDAPGCTATDTPGQYQFPVVPLSFEVFLNAQRLSTADQYTLSGQILTVANFSTSWPDVVVCNYTW